MPVKLDVRLLAAEPEGLVDGVGEGEGEGEGVALGEALALPLDDVGSIELEGDGQ